MTTTKSEYQSEVILCIKKLRTDRNISQIQLSDILSISPGQIGNIESSKFPHKYTLKQIHEVCKYCNYPIESVFLSEDETNLKKRDLIDLLISKLVEYDR
jgi:putative transcriptional regulator